MASVSAAQDDDDDAPVDGINITPLVDVLMVVLVMFILTATAQIAGIKVNLPKASSSMALSQPKTKAISVNDAGQVFLDAYPVTLPELEDRLRTEKALNPDFPVIVRGDAAAVPEGRGSAGSAAPPGTRPGRPGHRQAAIGAEANVMSFPESDSRARGVRRCAG